MAKKAAELAEDAATAFEAEDWAAAGRAYYRLASNEALAAAAADSFPEYHVAICYCEVDKPEEALKWLRISEKRHGAKLAEKHRNLRERIQGKAAPRPSRPPDDW